MKIGLVRILVLLAVIPTMTQAYTLEGTVYAPDGQLLPDVLIRLIDIQRREYGRDYSDRNGAYRISGLPKGLFELHATKHGYQEQVFEVSITGPSPRSTIYRDINFSDIQPGSRLTRAGLSDFYLPMDHRILPSALKHFNKGMKYIEKEKIDKALKAFDKSIAQDGSFSRAYTGRGIVLLKMFRFEEAAAAFETAATLNPADPLPLLNHGIHLNQNGNYEKSEELLRQAVELDPGIPKSHLALGESYYRMEQWEKAEFELSQGMMFNPAISKNHRLMLANTYVHMNRLADARDQYSLYLRENPYAENEKDIQEQIRKIESKLSMYQLPDMD
ncbi:tetratricopeptide repeat protein [bacterium]|nr:tetratricopeptide repeat protein [candidate division CSSED10-310 bacterium]